MAKKPVQLDLSERKDLAEIPDAFTGELFVPRAPNHYEANDGIPFAPPVDRPRMSLRDRVERLLYGGGQVPDGIYEDHDPTNWDDDGEEPLTPAEQAYAKAVVAAEELENVAAAQRKAAEKPTPKGGPKEKPAEKPADAPESPGGEGGEGAGGEAP